MSKETRGSIIQSGGLVDVFLSTLFYIIIPTFLIAWLCKNRNRSVKKWLFEIIFIGSYFLNLFFIGFWVVYPFGHIARYLLLVSFLIAAVKSYFTIRRSPQLNGKNPEPPKKQLAIHLVSYSIFVLLAGVFSWELFGAVKGSQNPGGSIELDFPLKNGVYYIIQGGNDSTLNHHHGVSAQKFALDIVKMNHLGLRTKNLLPSKEKDYNICGEDIYSPCSGLILKAMNTVKSMPVIEMNQTNPAGNFVAIKQEGTDNVIILAHLLDGSICVQEGDIICRGQLLGQVGSSGNSSEPHLHIHCASPNEAGDFLFQGEGIPLTFNNKFLIRNDSFIAK